MAFVPPHHGPLDPISLTIQSISGVVFSVKVDMSDTIAEVKSLIHKQSGPCPVAQQLIYAGDELVDTQTLRDLSPQHMTTMILVSNTDSNNVHIPKKKLEEMKQAAKLKVSQLNTELENKIQVIEHLRAKAKTSTNEANTLRDTVLKMSKDNAEFIKKVDKLAQLEIDRANDARALLAAAQELTESREETAKVVEECNALVLIITGLIGTAAGVVGFLASTTYLTKAIAIGKCCSIAIGVVGVACLCIGLYCYFK